MRTFFHRWELHAILMLLIVVIALVAAGVDAEAELQCNSCHGVSGSSDYRPIDDTYRNTSTGGFQGNHQSHMGATSNRLVCAKCHHNTADYTSSHRDGNINLASNINASPHLNKAGYNKDTFRGITSLPQTASNPATLGSCSNVNCHFESDSPKWGKDPSSTNCNTCHIAADQGGHHPGYLVGGKDKHGDYLGKTGNNSCSYCHLDHRLDSNQFSHATSLRSIKVQFTKYPYNDPKYIGTTNTAYPTYLPSQHTETGDGTCANYCHSDGRNGSPMVPVKWTTGPATQCFSCHKGKTGDENQFNCVNKINGTWDDSKGVCTPYLAMSSNGHHRLVGSQWIRKYPCYYCHKDTVDPLGNITSASKRSNHVNGQVNVRMADRWNIVGRPDARYDSQAKVCADVYCHSDGTSNPDKVRAFAWTDKKAECNACHGHPKGSCLDINCHDGRRDDKGKVWTRMSSWAPGKEWMGSMPMFANQGAGLPRANSHPRHARSNFTCDICHSLTVKTAPNGNGCIFTPGCHQEGKSPSGKMSEVSHLDGFYHVDKIKTVKFNAKTRGSYDPDLKKCSGTSCHKNGDDPVWGGSVNVSMTCLNCHGTPDSDVDVFAGFGNITTIPRISKNEWYNTGHGRYSTSGRYPKSKNPAANFPGNPCWYCHDNNVLHGYTSNRFRLRTHPQYEKRFEKECVYCHMEGTNDECLSCHKSSTESMAPQLSTIDSSGTVIATWPNNSSVHSIRPDHRGYTGSCQEGTGCHTSDGRIHNTGAGLWSPWLKDDIKNQYIKMGVCLQCHDDDSKNQCNSCHDSIKEPTKYPPEKYRLGFDPGMEGTRYIKPKQAKASASHFGYKHYRAYKKDGTWKGGKFCWNCHDPHGDSNIYMIHNEVATTTDAKQGMPKSVAPVKFKDKQSGYDYAQIPATLTSSKYEGICNVCHSPASKHFTSVSGDGHNITRPCTNCHQHRFSDSHASGKDTCNSCHTKSKPVPKHNAFGLPRDCIKCHGGIIGNRMDIVGQMQTNSHHVQGVPLSNKHCYQCHWEATVYGTIDPVYHEGYNFLRYTSVKAAKVDLVLYGNRTRPTTYRLYSTATTFLASKFTFGVLSSQRKEVNKITNHCLSCHSERNNNITPFDDCKTPRNYAWDRSSIAARYSQTGSSTVTPWGKVNSDTYTNANKKDKITKAFSAHGNATANKGGWSRQTGLDGTITNTRNGIYNVQCFDCHSSHGSKVTGVSSSYVSFNGTKNGGNLKETQAGKGGYLTNYIPSANPRTNTINTYAPGAGLCYDCHLSRDKGTATPSGGVTPWGYFQTFGALSSIKGYRDTDRFDNGVSGQMRNPYKSDPVKGGHMKRSGQALSSTPLRTIDNLCTPCHDPHGVSPALGNNQVYAVPLLKGTWITSPYKEDVAVDGPVSGPRGGKGIGSPSGVPYVYIDQNTFGGTAGIAEDDSKFSSLCLECHPKNTLTDGIDHTWKGKNRVHESVKGWKTANTTIQHQFTCSKCHLPHVSNLPRLMQTNCIDYQHRGRGVGGGAAGAGGRGSFPKGGGKPGENCHPTGAWPNNYWNKKTPWPPVP